MDGKLRRKNKRTDNTDDPFKPSSSELEIIHYIHKNVTSFEGKMSGCRVSYFFGRDAVDILMNSKWAKLNLKSKDTKQQHFTTEESVIKYMDKLLQKTVFSKAIKVKRKHMIKRKDEDKKKTKSKNLPDTKSEQTMSIVNDSEKKIPKEDSPSQIMNKVKKNIVNNTAEETWYSHLFSSSPVKKPARLEYSQEQVFSFDSDNQSTDEEVVYVWVYEPPPGLKVWLMGFSLILAIIGCCFFPIWPAPLRLGAYYLTLAALSFLGFLVVLALLRLSLYVIVFTSSLGMLHWWLFPNLFADCGFFESFRPLYCFDWASPIKEKRTKRIKEDGNDNIGDISNNQKTKKQE